MKACRWHKPAKLGYIAHHAWMEMQHKLGHRQKQCPKCLLWFFPSEWGREPKAEGGRP